MTLLENYCKILDAIELPPDTDVEVVISKIDSLKRQANEYAKELQKSTEALRLANKVIEHLSGE